jgi:peptidylprolyl isomerase
MAFLKSGDRARVHYTGKFEDGQVAVTSMHNGPIEVTLGSLEVIDGFEKALMGMQPGDSKSTRISAEEGYGPYNEDLVVTVKRSSLPTDMELKIGDQLEIVPEGGEVYVVTVAGFSGSDVILDMNHPLAGKDLIFDIQLLEIL